MLVSPKVTVKKNLRAEIQSSPGLNGRSDVQFSVKPGARARRRKVSPLVLPQVTKVIAASALALRSGTATVNTQPSQSEMRHSEESPSCRHSARDPRAGMALTCHAPHPRAIVGSWRRNILRLWINQSTAVICGWSTRRTAMGRIPCRQSSALSTRQAMRPASKRVTRKAIATRGWTRAPNRKQRRPAQRPAAGAGFWDFPASAAVLSCSATRLNVRAVKPR